VFLGGKELAGDDVFDRNLGDLTATIHDRDDLALLGTHDGLDHAYRFREWVRVVAVQAKADRDLAAQVLLELCCR
jgi:hypothetical protein